MRVEVDGGVEVGVEGCVRVEVEGGVEGGVKSGGMKSELVGGVRGK